MMVVCLESGAAWYTLYNKFAENMSDKNVGRFWKSGREMNDVGHLWDSSFYSGNQGILGNST
jgi:hypothetical protein